MAGVLLKTYQNQGRDKVYQKLMVCKDPGNYVRVIIGGIVAEQDWSMYPACICLKYKKKH